MKKITTLLLFALTLSVATAADGIRISWDYNQREFVNQGTYARVKKLSDNELALVYSVGANVYIKKKNVGSSWGNAIEVSRDNAGNYNYTNAEMIKLDNGNLLYTWNARPKSGTGQPYKIMTKLSENNGQTWHSEQDVYTAGTTAEDGCWEPIFLQLPSGELQIYFANEHNVTDRYQNITMMRSFDNGATWGNPEIVSYRYGARDGMPVPVYLQDDKGIAMAIEDNGINGLFKPVIIHTTTNDNWASGAVAGNSLSRWHALATSDRLASNIYAGAPYLIQLNNKQTVMSIQSTEGRNGTDHTYSVMQVYVGDENAQNFTHKSTPYPNLPAGANALWNSLCQINDSTVLAVMSLANTSGNNGVWTVAGKIMPPMECHGTGTVVEKWQYHSPIYIGSESLGNMHVKSMWDNDSLYFRFDVKDQKQVVGESGSAAWETDGVEVYLDLNDSNANSIVPGLYKLLVNIDNQTLLSQSATGQWLDWTPQIRYEVKRELITYSIEIAIPWAEIGGKPADYFKTHFKLHNNNSGTSIFHENLSGGNPDKPSSWMKCTLTGSGITNLGKTDQSKNGLVIYPNPVKKDNVFTITSPNNELLNSTIKIYDASTGRLLFNDIALTDTQPVQLSFSGMGMVVVNTPSGKTFCQKIIMK